MVDQTKFVYGDLVIVCGSERKGEHDQVVVSTPLFYHIMMDADGVRALVKKTNVSFIVDSGSNTSEGYPPKWLTQNVISSDEDSSLE
jgi:hypothetical protein